MNRGSSSHWNAPLGFRSTKKVQNHCSRWKKYILMPITGGFSSLVHMALSYISYHCNGVRLTSAIILWMNFLQGKIHFCRAKTYDTPPMKVWWLRPCPRQPLSWTAASKIEVHCASMWLQHSWCIVSWPWSPKRLVTPAINVTRVITKWTSIYGSKNQWNEILLNISSSHYLIIGANWGRNG